MDATLFNYVIIYTIVFSLICLIRDIFVLDDKNFTSIVKTFLIEILFTGLFFIGSVAMIVIIQMGFDQMEFIVNNQMYYMAVPIVASLFVILTK